MQRRVRVAGNVPTLGLAENARGATVQALVAYELLRHCAMHQETPLDIECQHTYNSTTIVTLVPECSQQYWNTCDSTTIVKTVPE